MSNVNMHNIYLLHMPPTASLLHNLVKICKYMFHANGFFFFVSKNHWHETYTYKFFIGQIKYVIIGIERSKICGELKFKTRNFGHHLLPNK